MARLPGVSCDMRQNAILNAVLATVVRATADRRIPVVLRTRQPERARELARWLRAAHGSDRTVIASATARGLIEVRLPRRFDWPHLGAREELIAALAATASVTHLSSMAHSSSPGGPG